MQALRASVPAAAARAFAALVCLACAALLQAGCAAGRERLGDVTLRPYGSVSRFTTFGVQERRILSPDLDALEDDRGCVRGLIGNDLLQLCKQAAAREPEVPGNVVQRWSGTSGDFTIELDGAGRSLRMDGYLRMGARSLPLMATLPFGRGRQWDELRRHPELLAIAAALARVGGEPDRNDLTRGR